MPTAARLFDKQGKLDLIRVGAKPGVSEAELASQIRPLLSETTEVQTATAQAASDSKDSKDGMSIFRMILLAFGGIALFVGSFVIANTLAITVAQRMRELATLRTLGASRKQVLGSVVLESVVVGFIASIVGLFAGLGIAKGLYALLAATGIDLPDEGLVLAPRTVLVEHHGRHTDRAAGKPPARHSRHPRSSDRRGSRGFGRCPRRGSPASRFPCRWWSRRSQSRCSPTARSPTASTRRFGSSRWQAASCCCSWALRWSLRASSARSRRSSARPVRVIGGSAGKLARQNAMRNPTRTASTAAAIMIGISLITFVAVLGQGLRSLVHECRRRAVRRRLQRVRRHRHGPLEQVGPGRGEGARRRGRLGDSGRRGQGRRQDRQRQRCRREPHEGREHEVVGRLGERSGAAGQATAPSSRSPTRTTTRSRSGRP